MKINHRYAILGDSEFATALRRINFPLDIGNGGFIVINITEDDPKWPDVQQLALAYNEEWSSLVTNVFTKSELRAAEWSLLSTSGHFGYPQPEDDYISVTYDTTNFCEHCGIGAVQRAPFRFRSEPKAPHSHFLKFNWVFDELFILPAVMERFQQADVSGIDYGIPVIHKNNQPLVTRWQLHINTILPPVLYTQGLQTVTCCLNNEETRQTHNPTTQITTPFCGRVKYHLTHHGLRAFQRKAFSGMPDFIKSSEWFGSGCRAFRLILVSNKVANMILDEKWRGYILEPIALVD